MPAPKDTLYYDGACSMCRRSIRIIRALDWLGRLRFVDSTALPDGELPVPRDESLVGIPMRTRSGRTLVGFPAVRRALLQTTLGVIPALLMYLPGVSHAGRAAYNRIAANRAREAVCTTDVRRVSPEDSSRRS